MKSSFPTTTGLIFALLAMAAGAQAPQAGSREAERPLIEIESQFFTIAADAAVRMGLTDGDPGPEAERKSTLNSGDVQKLSAKLSGESSVKLLSAPRVTTKSGQRAVIEIIREFRYPTQFEAAGSVLTPTNFETRNIGVTLEIEPVVTKGGLIDITSTPSITAFHRFANYAGGKTHPAGKIPKDGFAQPIFDHVTSTMTATLRTEQSLVLGGFAWHGADEFLFNRGGFDGEKAPAASVVGEGNLLFVLITARLAPPSAGSFGRGNARVKAGSPVEVSAHLGGATRGRLPEWMVAMSPGALVDGWTNLGLVDPSQVEELRKALGGEPNKAISAKTVKKAGVSLMGVVDAEKTDSLREAIERASGGPLADGPTKTLLPEQRYYAEAHGALRYAADSGAKGDKGDKGDRVELQLAVEAQCGDGGIIDLKISSHLGPTPHGQENPDAPGAGGRGARAEWKLLDQEPRWTQPAEVVAVSVGSGSAIVFMRASETNKDHLQILLITATGKEEGAEAAVMEAAKPSMAQTAVHGVSESSNPPAKQKRSFYERFFGAQSSAERTPPPAVTWERFPRGALPSGATLAAEEARMLKPGSYEQNVAYLVGDYVVTAAGKGRALLRPAGVPVSFRVVVETAAEETAKVEGAKVKLKATDGVLIRRVTRSADDELTVVTKAITKS